MYLSGLPRAALLTALLSLPAAGAMAQQQVITLPGMVIVVNPGGSPHAARGADPLQRMDALFAEHQARMARLTRDQEIGRMPDAAPSSLIGAMMDRMSGMRRDAALPPASGAVTCQESISITFSGQGGTPVVRTSRSGEGCGPAPRMAPTPAEIVPPPPAARPNLLEVNEPAPVAVEPRVRRRT